MTKSYDDLMAAFAGESQANRKYLAFAKKADDEGFAQVARLFRAAAAAETVHALTHFRTAGEVRSTEENLKVAIEGEHYENSEMYPTFMKDAEEEGDAKALKSFTWANEAEKIHEMLYREALETLGKPGETYDYYICPICGYTHARTAPEKCPVCGALGSKFEKIS
ncbi:MAG: rubrerythrin [Chloroflexi bacterium HGW-Chloroflexi-4]|jgi:rubrerythrin|nr:MAG: rubrerythrin [Chloroflexi bacterium HGW-Chloroflexi-4]